MPALVAEARASGSSMRDRVALARSPRGARASRRGSDYLAQRSATGTATRIVPSCWLRPEAEREIAEDVVAWLIHLEDLLEHRLAVAIGQVREHVANLLHASPSPQDEASDAAQSERRLLEELERQLEGTHQGLQRARRILDSSTARRTHGSSIRPRLSPRGPTWDRMAHVFASIVDPEIGLSDQLRGLLSGNVAGADVPYLYQRWCGLQLVRILEELGHGPRSNAIPVLFLGGELRLGERVRLFVEPRIPPGIEEPHACGLGNTSKSNATPDYVITCGTRAFVLDPSFSTDAERAHHKARYRQLLVHVPHRTLAGQPTFVPVDRAWAAQPLQRDHCLLHDPEARTGIVPMTPGRSNTALAMWMRDLVL